VTPDSPWLIGRPNPDARIRLLCFAHAGGSASAYLPWRASLPPFAELWAVQLPGRGGRLAEPPRTSFEGLLAELAPLLARFASLPFAFFGHSLGALLAFELARALRERGLALPHWLIASGSQAPAQRSPASRLLAADDAGLIAALREYGGTPEAILGDAELLALTLPALRADLALLADHRYRPAPPLPVPIAVLGGTGDPQVPFGALDAWKAETTHGCEISGFEGDHFFLHGPERARVLQAVSRTLARALGDGEPR
jgi:surfactin synthase thioesterase subunit